jgi:flagellar hook-associated protein 2
MEYRLTQTEARLRKQFTAMDAMVSQLQATSSYITQQLSGLNNNSGQ